MEGLRQKEKRSKAKKEEEEEEEGGLLPGGLGINSST